MAECCLQMPCAVLDAAWTMPLPAGGPAQNMSVAAGGAPRLLMAARLRDAQPMDGRLLATARLRSGPESPACRPAHRPLQTLRPGTREGARQRKWRNTRSPALVFYSSSAWRACPNQPRRQTRRAGFARLYSSAAWPFPSSAGCRTESRTPVSASVSSSHRLVLLPLRLSPFETRGGPPIGVCCYSARGHRLCSFFLHSFFHLTC